MRDYRAGFKGTARSSLGAELFCMELTQQGMALHMAKPKVDSTEYKLKKKNSDNNQRGVGGDLRRKETH